MCSISVILMDNDRSVNHSDKSNTGGWQYKNLSGTAFSGQDPTLFRDAESGAWVRKLLTPDPALDRSLLQMSKETRNFLWKAGMVPFVSSPQTADAPKEDSPAAAGHEAGTSNQSYYRSDSAGSGFNWTENRSENSNSRRSRPLSGHNTSFRSSGRSEAWDILSGSGPTSYADNASSGKRRSSRWQQKSSWRHSSGMQQNSGRRSGGRAGTAGSVKKATSTYASIRKSMQPRSSMRGKASPALSLLLVILITILITLGAFFLLKNTRSRYDTKPSDPPVFFGNWEYGKNNAADDILPEIRYISNRSCSIKYTIC